MPNTLIYIGNLAAIDTDETNYTAENPNLALGTYDNSVLQVVEATTTENNGLAGYQDDEMLPLLGYAHDTTTYDLGAGPVTTVADHTGDYEAEVLLDDGTVLTFTSLTLVQMTNGDVFLTEITDLDNLNIQSITLTAVGNQNYSGWTSDQSADNTSIVCFTRGTLIDTPAGKRAVETLTSGDLVNTLDNGVMPILWAGRRSVRCAEKTRSVEISAGALGAGLPSRPIRVSRQHRILLGSRITQRMCESDRAFIAAIHLVGQAGIQLAEQDGMIDYYHFLLDGHQVVFAEDVPAESLFPGTEAVNGLPEPSRLEIARLASVVTEPLDNWNLAYPVLRAKQRKAYFKRHLKNKKPLIEMSCAHGPDRFAKRLRA